MPHSVTADCCGLQKKVPNNLKLVAANSGYQISGTFALPGKSIGGCPKMQARSLHGNRNTICFAALGKHNCDWPQANDRAFSTKPLRISTAVRSPKYCRRRSGFIVENTGRAVGKIEQISRARCRQEFEQRFTDRHMAEDYVRIYQQLLSRSSTQAAA